MNSQSKVELIKAAVAARANAYAPYSVYHVGAAALSADGSIASGCNVENASFGLTVCAERNAIAAMVAGGHAVLEAVAVATEDGAVPCGACLQVMAEFASGSSMPVFLVSETGTVTEKKMEELLPSAFSGGNLKKC